MKIQVLSGFDYVESVDPGDLKRLIFEKKIAAFKRRGGWVKIGTDPVRGCGGVDYNGPERRDIVQKPLSEKCKRAAMSCVLWVTKPRKG